MVNKIIDTARAHREDVYRRAEYVFGDREKAQLWLNSPIKSLGGQVPEQLLDSDEGIERVLHVLGLIEWGVYS